LYSYIVQHSGMPSLSFKKLDNLYSSRLLFGLSRQENEMGWTRRTYEKRDVYGALVGKPEGQRPLAIRTRGWENNIKIDLTEMERDNVV